MPVALRAMPPIDLVLVSHDHYDHLDYPTIRELAKRDVPFVTSLGVGAHLEAWGVPPERIVELDWWESHSAAEHRAHGDRRAVAALFRARPERSQRDAVVVAGHALASGTRFSSAAIPVSRRNTRTIRERLGPFDLVMLEVGAFHPAWGDIHLGPENALKALALLGGGAVPARALGHIQPRDACVGSACRRRCWSWGRKRARNS